MARLILPGKTACFRCLQRQLPEPGSVRTCDTSGIIGPAALLAASIQTSIALQFLTDKLLAPTALLVADAWHFSLDAIAVSRSENCPCCALGQFDFLSSRRQQAVTLCGRNAVQVRPAFDRRPDFGALASRFRRAHCARKRSVAPVGGATLRTHVVRRWACIVRGTDDPALARSLVARWIGIERHPGSNSSTSSVVYTTSCESALQTRATYAATTACRKPEGRSPRAPHCCPWTKSKGWFESGVNLGLRKIRLNGGEPLVRKDLSTLISRLMCIDGVEKYCPDHQWRFAR